MHEVSLVLSLFDDLAESARLNGISRISTVRLVIGQDRLVLPAALLFAFEQLKREPLTPDAALVIEERPGRELYIDHYEGEP